MDLGYLKERIDKLEDKHKSDNDGFSNTYKKGEFQNSLKVTYLSLQKDTSINGVIIPLLDESGKEQDFISIKELFKFGRKYIEKTPKNVKIISDIPNMDEYYSKYKSVKEYDLSYGSIENLYIPIFNQQKDPNIIIINFRYYSRVAQVLKEMYRLFESIGNNIYNTILTFAILKDGTVSITQKGTVKDLDTLFSKNIPNYNKDTFQKTIYRIVNKQKDLTKEDIRSIVSTWVSSLMKTTSNTKLDDIPNIRKSEMQTDDDFFNSKSYSKKESGTSQKKEKIAEPDTSADDDDFFSSLSSPSQDKTDFPPF